MKQPVVREHHRHLKEVFKTDNPQMMARVICLCVLFEDLRIEYQGAISQVEIPRLDTAGKNYRQFYFIRRSLVSMIEFSGALSRLNSHPHKVTRACSVSNRPTRTALPSRAMKSSRFRRRAEAVRSSTRAPVLPSSSTARRPAHETPY
jgi:hypothetical protein